MNLGNSPMGPETAERRAVERKREENIETTPFQQGSQFISELVVSLTISKTPRYLRESALHRNLVGDDSDCAKITDSETTSPNHSAMMVEFPIGYMYMDPTVTIPAYLRHLLRTLHFWDCATVPNKLIKYCVSLLRRNPRKGNAVSHLRERLTTTRILDEFSSMMHMLKPLLGVMNLDCLEDVQKRFVIAARSGDVSLLRCLHRLELRQNKFAARYRSSLDQEEIKTLRYKYKYVSDIYCWGPMLCAAAAGAGQVPCLEYAIRH